MFGADGWVGEQGWRQDFKTDPPTWTNIARGTLPGMESPAYFTTAPPDAEMMSVSELQSYISDLEPSGFNTTPLKVELHRKLAFPFVTLVMTLLAVPFGVSAGRHGALYGIGLGIVIALAVLDSDQRLRRDRQGWPPHAGARRLGPEHPRRRTGGLLVSARAHVVRQSRLGASSCRAATRSLARIPCR